MMKTTIRFVALAVLAAVTIAPATAQTVLDPEGRPYPSRPIRMLVPFPPGGPADLIARVVGQRMTEDFGQPVVVDNRAGGNTAIGAQAVARAPADGYTLLVPMDTTLVMNPLVMQNLPYDPIKDFAPVTLLTKSMSLIVTRASDGPKSIKELIAKAKANPGRLNMGAGTITSRLGALMFAKAAGIDAQLVPFKGSAEIGQAVLAGTVDFALDSTGTSLPLIQGGQYRALAKYTNRPWPLMPDLPSLAEAADLPSIGESSTWIALAAPAGTPLPIIERIQRAVASVYADPTMTERLEKAGIFPVASTPAELAAFIRAETERWTTVFRENSNLKLVD
jgi:tripartite-type tricarboxylate transporter receptor subunit TctC